MTPRTHAGVSSKGQITSNPVDGTPPHPTLAPEVCTFVLSSPLQAGATQPDEEEEGSQDGWETASEASEGGEVEMEEQAEAGDEEESDHKFLPGTEQVSERLFEPPVKVMILPVVCPSYELEVCFSSTSMF